MCLAWLLFLLPLVISTKDNDSPNIACFQNDNIHDTVLGKIFHEHKAPDNYQCRYTFKFPSQCTNKEQAKKIKILSVPLRYKDKTLTSEGLHCEWQSDTEVQVFYDKPEYTEMKFGGFIKFMAKAKHQTCDKKGSLDRQELWKCAKLMIPPKTEDGEPSPGPGPGPGPAPGPSPPRITAPPRRREDGATTTSGRNDTADSETGKLGNAKSEEDSKEDGGFPIWAIILIVVAALLLIAVPIIVFVVIRKQKSKKNPGALSGDQEKNKKAGEGDDDEDDDKSNTTKTDKTATMNTATKTMTKTGTVSRTPTRTPTKSIKGIGGKSKKAGASTLKSTTKKTKMPKSSASAMKDRKKRAMPPTLKLSMKQTTRH